MGNNYARNQVFDELILAVTSEGKKKFGFERIHEITFFRGRIVLLKQRPGAIVSKFLT